MIPRSLTRDARQGAIIEATPVRAKLCARVGLLRRARAALSWAHMSIVWSLKRLFDPATHQREEGERHAEREQPKRTDEGDPPGFQVEARPAPEAPAQRFRCRVCGYESGAGAYCPDCLADTMAPQPAGAPDRAPSEDG